MFSAMLLIGAIKYLQTMLFTDLLSWQLAIGNETCNLPR